MWVGLQGGSYWAASGEQRGAAYAGLVAGHCCRWSGLAALLQAHHPLKLPGMGSKARCAPQA